MYQLIFNTKICLVNENPKLPCNVTDAPSNECVPTYDIMAAQTAAVVIPDNSSIGENTPGVSNECVEEQPYRVAY